MEDDDPKTLGFTIAGHTPAPGRHSCTTCGLELPITIGSCPKDGTPISHHHGGDLNIKLVGNYEFLEFIGAGGMGVIYKARHPVLNRLVAIKMLHGHLVSDAIINRFRQEAQAVSGLEHPNIIHVHDFGVSEHGQPYMVMDFIEGQPLSEVLKNKQLSVPAIINIMTHLADGLQHAHDRGVLHRDLKPSNIMITEGEGEFPDVKIVDFGIAKILESESTRMTQTGELIGTPQYMSPEQCRGGQLDHRSDIYSLGCVMFEGITGKTLFSSESMVAIIVDQMNTPPRTLREVRPDKKFPGQLEDLIAKTLAKDPADRYQSMTLLKEELIPIQALVAQQESNDFSPMRLFRLNREQRNLLLLLLGSVATLATVAVTSVSFVKVVRDAQPMRITNDIFAPQKLAFPTKVKSEDLANRQDWYSFIDFNKVTDKFVASYFDVDLQQPKLELEHSKITIASMPFIGLQTATKSLNLDDTSINDKALPYLLPLKKLTDLSLKNTNVSDEGMTSLAKIPSLTSLHLDETGVGDGGVENLGELPLEVLSLSNTKIGPAALKALSKMPTLSKLTLEGYAPPRGEKGFSFLSESKGLERLCLGHSDITADDLEDISKIQGLKKLDLNNSKIDIEGLESLSHSKIYDLDLSDTAFDVSWLPDLSKMSNLTSLHVSDTQLDDPLLGEIVKQLPNLRNLSLAGTAVTSSGLSQLGKMKQLKYINIADCKLESSDVRALEGRLPGVGIETARNF